MPRMPSRAVAVHPCQPPSAAPCFHAQIKLPGAEPFRLCRELLDGVVMVDNGTIATALKVRVLLLPAYSLLCMSRGGKFVAPASASSYCQPIIFDAFPQPQDVFNETRTILEPAGAVALAGAKAYLQVCLSL